MAQSIGATALDIEDKFAKSLEDSPSYPLNLVQKQTYSATLHAYQQRLNDEASRLFEDAGSEIDVPIRDFSRSTNRTSCCLYVKLPTKVTRF